ncbi:hypothetical protein LWI29_004107 [Acer saccharum]|uniref:Uncharacterized protein n=1 Tax=Acer saccharum TaxID=4024 RepID=A0AA39SXJ1_ACESA|nr:hypothetical protein LWI29_004107 [Acer saccharum]
MPAHVLQLAVPSQRNSSAVLMILHQTVYRFLVQKWGSDSACFTVLGSEETAEEAVEVDKKTFGLRDPVLDRVTIWCLELVSSEDCSWRDTQIAG